jgi:signal transduction histidine kinase
MTVNAVMAKLDPRDLALGLVVLVLGLVEAATGPGFAALRYGYGPPAADWWSFLFAIVVAAAVASARRFPGEALAVCWVLAVLQLAVGSPVTLVELSLAWVAFCCARWGSAVELALAGVSGPSAAVLVVAAGIGVPLLGGERLVRVLVDGVGSNRPLFLVAGALVGSIVALGPWLVGLAFRYGDRARVSAAGEERATATAAESMEVARLQEQQARLARDVHDVVGHSLTVILSQAEAAQYLPDDPVRLKQTLATIAGSARSSLLDVRHVLAATTGPAPDVDVLSQVIESARGSGVRVEDSVEGTPQPLPPELAEVARRVLQEMLTNALRHGDRTRPIVVERHWQGDLRIEVTNVCPAEEATVVLGSGSGIEGMRHRLASVGGGLDVRRRSGDPSTFTATAWVPVRPR